VFDTLLRFEPDGTVVPNAAEDFAFNDERTELTLTLRDGMSFTDGAPVDSAAVQVNLENMRDGGGSDSSRLAGIEIETPDDLTVVITTPEPRGLLPDFLAPAPGIIANPGSLTSEDVATTPVGSGPYTLDAANTTSGSTCNYVRNEDYWNAEAYPYDTIVMRVLEDQTARLSALRSGQINAVVSNQIFNPENEAYDESLLEEYPFDVEAARALMAEAGYADGFDVTIPDIAVAGLNAGNPLIVQKYTRMLLASTLDGARLREPLSGTGTKR
jgi:peptide/nickel transport system substrate-binding protein